MRTILILCLSILFLPLTLAAEGDLTVIGGTENTDYSYADNVYTVLTGTALTFSGTTTTDRIVVKEGVTADIILDNVDIQFTTFDQRGDGMAAFHINKNASATITLANTNILTSNGKSSGLEVPKYASVIIQGKGKLTATGGQSSGDAGAGIGTRKDLGSGNITIQSGTIIANGGNGYGSYRSNYSGYGIGSYSGENVIINGGIITANGGTSAASGNGDCILNPIINGGIFTNCKEINNIVSMDDTNCTFINCKLSSNNPVTLTKDYSDCKFNGNTTIKGGAYTNCTFNKIVFFDETRCTFTKCNISFKNPTTLTKDYSGCIFNNNITIASGNYTNCTLKDNITINDGTFTNCPISGNKVIINKGTINNTDYNRITSDEIIINGGNIKITIPQRENGIGIHSIETKKLIIYGGNIFIEGQSYVTNSDINKNIGGNAINATESVEIYGGTINLLGGGRDRSSGGWHAAPGLAINSPKIIIDGGSLYAKCGSPWSSFPFEESTIKNQNNTDIYLGITPEIANATDVSVDDVPFYISGNHPEGDNKLYLYMTGTTHKVAIRADGKVTTYDVEYNSSGNNNDGYFNFKNKAESTLSETSKISFDPNDITTTYNKGSNELTVTLTITKTPISRSAAMNSVQLTLTDEAGNYIESNRQIVTGSDKYTFTFDTKGLDAGNYTLTANYGGSTTSLAANEETKTLTIEKAEGSKADDYEEPIPIAIYGQTLADVTLPNGWEWNTSETSVGNVVTPANTFAATFTPADRKNYNLVTKNLPVTVNKAKASDPENPVVTSPSSVTYGAKLSDITISNSWQWEDGTIVPTVTNSGYMAYYPVTDYDNYDWNGISGYNETDHQVKRTVAVTVNKADLSAADFTFTAPTDLVYNGNKKEATIKANDGLIGVGNITFKYYKEGEIMPVAPTEVGTYTVKIDVAGGDNYNSANDLNAPEWTFTILPKQYAIAIDPAIANGTVTADKTQAIEGETVTLTVTPAQGYEQETLSYTTDGGTTETITGTTFVMPAADVTVTATFKASSVPPVNPPVIPDDPAPVRYTVTLPVVEGAATDPAAGSYEVESWGSFSFLLTLGEGYRKDSHPVVTARGETLTPNASTGKYIIPNVQSDITVGITGIVKDVATGNESLTDGFHITTSGRLLLVTVPRAIRLYLTDTSGRLILTRQLPAGDTRIDDLAAGVYLLTLEGEKTKKIIIR